MVDPPTLAILSEAIFGIPSTSARDPQDAPRRSKTVPRRPKTPPRRSQEAPRRDFNESGEALWEPIGSTIVSLKNYVSKSVEGSKLRRFGSMLATIFDYFLSPSSWSHLGS